MNDWDRCRGCKRKFKGGEGRGYLRGTGHKSRMIWACGESCLDKYEDRKKRRLRRKRRQAVVSA